MRGLIIAVALTLPCLALASEDDPFADEGSEAPRSTKQPEPKPQPSAPAGEEAVPEAPPAPAPAASEPKAGPPAPPAKAVQPTASDLPRRVQPQPGVPTGKVAVLVAALDPAANEGALAFERQLALAFAAEGRLVPIDLERTLAGTAAPEARPEIQAHLDAGRKAFDNLELDAAAEEYLAAIRMMLEQPATAVPSEIAHAFTLSGAAYALNGDTKRSQAAFRHAAVIAPDWNAPAAEFSPDIIEAFAAAQNAVAAGAKGTLSITASASPAIAFVDGREAGIAPLELKELPSGRHHVLVKCRAHELWATFVLIPEGAAARADATLEEQPQAAALARGQQAALVEAGAGHAGPGAQELGKLLEASYLVLGTARSGPASGIRVEYRALELSTGRVASSGERAVTPGAASFEADLKALAPQLSAAFLDPILVAQRPQATPLQERWWFWPAVGGVAAVAVGAAVCGIVAASGSGAPTLLTTGIP